MNLQSNSAKDQIDNLSISTNDSLPCPPQAVPPSPVYEPYEELVNEAVFRGCKKVSQVKELLLKFEEHCIADNLIDRPMAFKFMGESIKLLSMLLPKFDSMKYQHHEAIALSILYISTAEVHLSRRAFLKSIGKLVKKKCSKLSTIRKSKSYILLKNILGNQKALSSSKVGVVVPSGVVPGYCY